MKWPNGGKAVNEPAGFLPVLQAFTGNVPSIPDFKSLLRCSDVALAWNLRSPPCSCLITVCFWHMPLAAFLSPFVCLGWYKLGLSVPSLPVPQQGNPAGPQDISPSGLLAFLPARDPPPRLSPPSIALCPAWCPPRLSSSFNSTVLGPMSCEAVSASPLRIPETPRWLYEVTGISLSLFCVKT